MSVNTFKFSQHGNDTAQITKATGAEMTGLSGLTATAAELNKLAGVTAGTVTVSKALVVGASKDLDALTVTSLTTTNPAIGDQVVVNLSVPTITAIAGGTKIIAVAPFTGTVVRGDAAVDAAFTTTDIVITTKIGASAITTGVMTIATAGSAALSTISCTPSALNTFTAGQVLNCTITGGVGTCGGHIQLLLKRTA